MEPNGLDGFESLSLMRAKAALAQVPTRVGTNHSLSAKPADTDAKRWKTSLEFEAMFLSQMYKSMRQTVVHNEWTAPSFGREMFTEMLDNEAASANANSPYFSGSAGLAAAERGKFSGLAGQIYKALSAATGFAASSGAGNSLSETELNPLVEEAAGQYGLSPNLLRSVIRTESGNNPHAVSSQGAKGLMQLMDSTATDLGVRNAFDPRENVQGGARYLRGMMEKFDWDERKALAGYNAGPEAVRRHGGVPPFPETRDYIDRVLRHRDALDAKETR